MQNDDRVREAELALARHDALLIQSRVSQIMMMDNDPALLIQSRVSQIMMMDNDNNAE
jgi:hypothetical protein